MTYFRRTGFRSTENMKHQASPYQHCAAMRYHAVPSLAIAQLREPEAAVRAANRFTAAAVFGVAV
jgi:hypothetical protein